MPIYSFWCVYDFSWEDERFDESVISLKKLSGESSVWAGIRLTAQIRRLEYETETWQSTLRPSDGTGISKARSQPRFTPSRRASPHPPHEGGGDCYRDTNTAMDNSTSNFRGTASHRSHVKSRQPSIYEGRQPVATAAWWGLPSLLISLLLALGVLPASKYGGGVGMMGPLGYQRMGW